MVEDYGTPVPPVDEYHEAVPQKNNNKNIVLIIVAVLVVLCCCCVGVASLFYFVLGDVILEAIEVQLITPALLSLI